MFCSPVIRPKARKEHRCDNCGQTILKGEIYARWMSVEDSMMTNKMHEECLKSWEEDALGGQFEYTLYDGERPEKK